MSEVETCSFQAELVLLDEICCHVGVDNRDIELPNISRFSNFNRLIRATAFYLRMREVLALPRKEKPAEFSIDVHHMKNASNLWFKQVQNEAFAEEITWLRNKGFVKQSSPLCQYSPFQDSEGILRMRGRVQDTYQPYEVNNPIILPNNHPLVTMLISLYHGANARQGVDTVINNLRQRYRILSVRSQVKRFIHECIKCKEMRQKPNTTMIAELPPERTTPSVFPFTYTGTDYCGPFHVKVDKRLEKRYVVIFT